MKGGCLLPKKFLFSSSTERQTEAKANLILLEYSDVRTGDERTHK